MKNTLLYNLDKNQILKDLLFCMKYAKTYRKEIEILLTQATGKLLSHGAMRGYHGNLWKCLVAEEISMDENAYALLCEKNGSIIGTMNEAALHDIKIIYTYFTYNFEKLKKTYPDVCIDLILDFTFDEKEEGYKKQVITYLIDDLAFKMNKSTSENEMKQVITDFYKNVGVGMFGLYKAFRINDYNEKGTSLLPIKNIESVLLDDLVGYDYAKQKLISNTEAFIKGRPANNCLLFGDAGTGKSSSVKGILNAYYSEGLRIIEVYKHQFKNLNDLMEILKERNYKFIIFMDDLSFEDFEVEYKYLKGVIEGGLASKADNVLIYATSNRRHLIRENYSDKEEIREDMHTSDTVQEKLSLVARFGVSIFFCRPNRKEFAKIVTTLAKRYHISMEEDALLYEANRWEMSHGGLSGRTAKQFIDYIRGEKKK